MTDPDNAYQFDPRNTCHREKENVENTKYIVQYFRQKNDSIPPSDSAQVLTLYIPPTPVEKLHKLQ
jgi:hypothetical protein